MDRAYDSFRTSTRPAAGGSSSMQGGGTANFTSSTAHMGRAGAGQVPKSEWEQRYAAYQTGASSSYPESSQSMRNSSRPTGMQNSTRPTGMYNSSRPTQGTTVYPSVSSVSNAANSSQQAFDNATIPGIGLRSRNNSSGNDPFAPHVAALISAATDRGVSEAEAEQKRVQLVDFVLRENDGGRLVAHSIRKRMKVPDDVIVLNTLTLVDELMRTCPFFYRCVANDLFFRRMWRFVNPNYKDGVKQLFKKPSTVGPEDLKREITLRVLILVRAWGEELQRMFKRGFEPAAAFWIERYNSKKQKVRFPDVPPSDIPWICPPGGVLGRKKRSGSDEDFSVEGMTLSEVETSVGLLENILDNATSVRDDLKENDVAVEVVKRLRKIGNRMEEFVARNVPEEQLPHAFEVSERLSRALRDYDSSLVVETVVREATAPVVDFESNNGSSAHSDAMRDHYGPGEPHYDHPPEYDHYEAPDHPRDEYPPMVHAPPPPPPPPEHYERATSGPRPAMGPEAYPEEAGGRGSGEPDGKSAKKNGNKKKKSKSKKKVVSSEEESEAEDDSVANGKSSSEESSEETDSEEENRRRRARKKKNAAKEKERRKAKKGKEKSEDPFKSMAARVEERQIDPQILAAHIASLNMARQQQAPPPDPYSAALLAMYMSQHNPAAAAAAFQSVNPSTYRTVNPAAYQTVNPTPSTSVANMSVPNLGALYQQQPQQHPQQQNLMRAYTSVNPTQSVNPMVSHTSSVSSGQQSVHPGAPWGASTAQSSHTLASVAAPQAPVAPAQVSSNPPPPPIVPITTAGPPPPALNPGAVDPAAAFAAYHSFLQMYSSTAPPPPGPPPMDPTAAPPAPIGVAPVQGSDPAGTKAAAPVTQALEGNAQGPSAPNGKTA